MKKIIIYVFSVLYITNCLAQPINDINLTKQIDTLSIHDLNKQRLFNVSNKTTSVAKTTASVLKLPYPVIFIHGYASNALTWNTTANFLDANFAFTYGGCFNYCLNSDNNNYNSNLNFYPTNGADLTIFQSTWKAGDYYYINFDVGSTGYTPASSNSIYDVKSNQASIYKQGLAIRDAIQRVLQMTGRDKVVLVCHSMGGLAARQYLQNPSNWQSNGQSRVAKLVTLGTPHLGTNINNLLYDCSSDAYRDLRNTYSLTNNNSVFLFGGYESNSVMNLSFCPNFYNVDVNCNGIVGEYVSGLNNKNPILEIDYAIINADCSGCANELPGDGIVKNSSSNLNNVYPNLTNNLFTYSSSGLIEIHTDLPKQYQYIMKGIDEPSDFNLAYKIDFDTIYSAFVTVQSPNSQYFYDYDDFKFTVVNNSLVTLNTTNYNLPNLSAYIVDANYNIITPTFLLNGVNYNSFSLSPGDYYLEFVSTTPAVNAYLNPYKFKLTKSPISSSIIENRCYNDIKISPSPVKSEINIIGKNNFINSNIEIYSVFGQLVLSVPYSDKIDVSNLIKGVYVIKIIKDSNDAFISKFIKD